MNLNQASHALENLITQEQFMNKYAYAVIKAVLEELVAQLKAQSKKTKRSTKD